MIDKILEFSVRQRILVLMGALALLLGGLWSATKLPMDAIPDITGVQVQVNTTVSALAPDEVDPESGKTFGEIADKLRPLSINFQRIKGPEI